MTEDELDALPEGSIIYAEGMKRPFLLEDDGWFSLWRQDKPVYDYIAKIRSGELPARVIFNPDTTQ